MLFNKLAAMHNVRNREGKRVFYLGKGDSLTSDARDYLASQRIEVLPAELARPDRFSLLGGGFIEEKPEHFTHLNSQILVPKTHPRILFRGRMDTLEAELLLCAQYADSKTKEQLQQVLDYARLILRWEVMDEPVQEMSLCGLTEAQLRQRSHRPQEFYGQPHFAPDLSDSVLLLQINRARCAARAAELAAVDAFTDREGTPTRTDLLLAMNRLSSMLYILMIQQKAKKGETPYGH